MAVASARLGSVVGLVAGSKAKVVTCPAHRTLVVRTATAHNGSGAAVGVLVTVRTPVAHIYTLFRVAPAANATTTVSGAFYVLHPGDELYAEVQSTATGTLPVELTVHGANLDGAPPLPAGSQS